jgi:hypothetical protein
MPEDDGWSGEGYDKEAPKGGSFLRVYLSKLGQQMVLRLGTGALRYVDAQYNNQKKVCWGAILRADSERPQDEPRAVLFDGGTLVYGLVKALSDDPKFGDPTCYDITVTRNEGDYATYYSVDVSSKIDRGLTKAEVDMLVAAGVDTVGHVAVALASSQKPKPTTGAEDGDMDDPFAGK